MRTLKLKKMMFVFVMAGLMQSAPAMAVSECAVTLNSVFVGQGIFYMNTPNGQAYFSTSLADAKPMMSSVLISKSLGKGIWIRFAADGVNCSSMGSRSDVVGVWNL